MKIAVWNDLNSGGGKRALYNHVKGLIDRGHEVVSFCPDSADIKFLPLSELVEEHVFPLNNGTKKRRLSSYFSSKMKVRTEEMLLNCKECADVINNGNFDVLFANSSSFSYMAHIGRYVKLPKVIYLGEPFRYLYEAHPKFLWNAPSAEKNILKYFISRLAHLYKMYKFSYMGREEYISAESYDYILVNSFFSRESVKRAYNLDSKVCYLGIDTVKFKYSGDKKGDYVIGVGYIQAAKGIDTVINALAIIEEELRPTLIWVCNNKVRNNFIIEMENLAMASKVDFVVKTMISETELQNLLAGARAFLYFPNLEPFGLAPLEANAMGTAVISVAEGGPRESIIHGVNGYLVNDRSYAEIASYIKLFFSDDNLAYSMGKQSRAYVEEKWNLSLSTDNIESWLKKLIVKN